MISKRERITASWIYSKHRWHAILRIAAGACPRCSGRCWPRQHHKFRCPVYLGHGTQMTIRERWRMVPVSVRKARRRL